MAKRVYELSNTANYLIPGPRISTYSPFATYLGSVSPEAASALSIVLCAAKEEQEMQVS
jgi:hypothetical protein